MPPNKGLKSTNPPPAGPRLSPDVERLLSSKLNGGIGSVGVIPAQTQGVIATFDVSVFSFCELGVWENRLY